MSQNTKNVNGFYIGFLAGSTVGAIVALLTAPKSGKNLRNEIKEKTGEYINEVDSYLLEAKNSAGVLIDETRKKFSDLLSKPEGIYKDAERVIKDAKGKTIDAYSFGREKVETEKERLTSSVKAGINTYNDEKNKS